MVGVDGSCFGFCPAGIACIALTFVDEHGSPTLLPHGERPDPLKLPCPSPIVGLLQDSDFESLTAVSRHQPGAEPPPSGGELASSCHCPQPPHPLGGWEGRAEEPCRAPLSPQSLACGCAWISGRRATSACCSCRRSCAGPCATRSATPSWSSSCCRPPCAWKPPAPSVLQTWRT